MTCNALQMQENKNKTRRICIFLFLLHVLYLTPNQIKSLKIHNEINFLNQQRCLGGKMWKYGMVWQNDVSSSIHGRGKMQRKTEQQRSCLMNSQIHFQNISPCVYLLWILSTTILHVFVFHIEYKMI